MPETSVMDPDAVCCCVARGALAVTTSRAQPDPMAAISGRLNSRLVKVDIAILPEFGHLTLPPYCEVELRSARNQNCQRAVSKRSSDDNKRRLAWVGAFFRSEPRGYARQNTPS